MKQRSFLFVPASSEKLIRKGLESEADRVIFDLEDAIAINEKVSSRKRLLTILLTEENLNPYFIRINDAESPYYAEDVETLKRIPNIGVALPKTTSASQIQELQRELPGRSILPIIENAAGVWYAKEIADSCEEIETLAFGAVDFSLDIKATPLPLEQELLYARSQIVLACRLANKKGPIDSVFTDFHDSNGFNTQASRVKGLGFQGKLLIHPKQVHLANTVFSPSTEEIKQARKIVDAFEEAESQGIAAIQVDGRMIDYPIVKQAQTILENTESS